MPDGRSSRNRAPGSAHNPTVKASFRRLRFVGLRIAEWVGIWLRHGGRPSDPLHDDVDNVSVLRAAENLVCSTATRQVFVGPRFVEQHGYSPYVALGGSID